MAKIFQVSRCLTSCFSEGRLQIVEVQVALRSGLPRFDIIGLPENMIREGKDRILAALSSIGLELPPQKILVHLIPGDIPKEGSHFDLPIMIALLRAMGMIADQKEKTFYFGEIELDGGIRPCPQLLPALVAAESANADYLYFHPDSFPDQKFESLLTARPVPIRNLRDVFDLPPPNPKPPSEDLEKLWVQDASPSLWDCLQGIPEQFEVFAIACFSRTHILLDGPPGIGKSRWCFSSRELDMPLSRDLLLERFKFRMEHSFSSPFQSPHHSSSRAAIVGGGSGQVLAGALTRAHGGAIFFDEFPLFSRDVIESLREALENKWITIARGSQAEKLPADVRFMAAMNCCPCGNIGSKKYCGCKPSEVERYRARVSGAIRDRIHWKMEWFHSKGNCPKDLLRQSLRERFLAFQNLNPKLNLQVLPEFDSPRAERIYLQKLLAFGRFHGLEEITDQHQENFQNLERTLYDRVVPDLRRYGEIRVWPSPIPLGT